MYVTPDMLFGMRTTVRLDEGLLTRAKQLAAKRGETLTSLLERGLRLAMSGTHKRTTTVRVTLPVSKARGGLLPGVDLDESAALLDRLDGVA
jgi:hypothetical protein